MKNYQFASVLLYLQESKELTKAKATNDFIEEHQNGDRNFKVSDLVLGKQAVTEEIMQYLDKFIAKNMKSTNLIFNQFVQKHRNGLFSIGEEDETPVQPKQLVNVTHNRSAGEY